ncbi:MAG TPA: hypothetical protein VI701_06045 [Anaerolineales bacterium]|nr:hypothetical protein [Anaerolineales bacterium]
MRSISFRTILISAAVGFFALGVATTLVRAPTTGSRTTTTPTARPRSTAPSVETPQVTVLILGVDTLADNGELLAVWLASFRPPGKELFLFGFPTDRTLADGTTLREAYAAGADPAQALGSLTSLPLDAVVVLDGDGFAGLIDFLGGVPTGETTVDGAAALNILALLRDDPPASLLAQARLLEALAGRAAAVQPGTDLQPMLGLVPDHASVSLSVEQALTMVAPYLPFESDRVHVALPSAPSTAADG